MRMPGLFCEFCEFLGHGFEIDVPGEVLSGHGFEIDVPRGAVSHLRNRFVYVKGAYHIYGIIPCTRKERITSSKVFRVRERCVSHLRKRFVYAKGAYHIFE